MQPWWVWAVLLKLTAIIIYFSKAVKKFWEKEKKKKYQWGLGFFLFYKELFIRLRKIQQWVLVFLQVKEKALGGFWQDTKAAFSYSPWWFLTGHWGCLQLFSTAPIFVSRQDLRVSSYSRRSPCPGVLGNCASHWSIECNFSVIKVEVFVCLFVFSPV